MAEPDPTNYNTPEGQAIGASQADLQHDVETLQAYGGAHPDEFTSAGFDNYPDLKVVGYFTAHLDAHESAIRSQLQHPDQFEVRKGAQSDRDRERMQQSLQDDTDVRPLMRQSFSGATGVITLDLQPSNRARAVSRALAARWGGALCVTLAGHPFPKGAWPDTTTCPPIGAMSDRNPDVEFRLALKSSTFGRGEVGTGTARITNHGTTRLTAETGSSLYASIVKPGTADRIGWLFEAQTAMARTITVEPGQTSEFEFRFGSDDCRATGDYALPAGHYGLLMGLGGFGRSDEAAITIVDE